MAAKKSVKKPVKKTTTRAAAKPAAKASAAKALARKPVATRTTKAAPRRTATKTKTASTKRAAKENENPLRAALFDSAGAAQGHIDLPEHIFGEEPNTPVMHQAYVRQMANARQGTASTKNRGAVSGGGAKPYRQKGTGRARHG